MNGTETFNSGIIVFITIIIVFIITMSLVFTHMTKLNDSLKSKWTKEAILVELSNFSDEYHFKIGNRDAYNIAYHYFPFLVKGYYDTLQQTKVELKEVEAIRSESKQYSSKTDFKRANAIMHRKAIKKGILDTLFENVSSYGLRDSVYIWRAEGNLYKIGITSSNRDHDRINQVARSGGFNDIELIKLAKVNDAYKLEKQLLKLGKPALFEESFTGSTEFRYYTFKELVQAIASIESNETIDSIASPVL
jgi:hypothetical protein